METKRHGHTPKILVVDDHETSGRYLLSVLSRLNAVTQRTYTGEGGLRIAIAWLPQLIFMDFLLPDASGIDVARQIRNRWPSSHAPAKIVLLSAQNPAIPQQQLDSLDIQHTLVKPVSGAILRELALELVGQSPAWPAPRENTPQLCELFISELKEQLPMLEYHLSRDDTEQAISLVHQLIASAAMTGEKKLEEKFSLLDRLLRRKSGSAELARVYYRLFEETQAFMHKTG